MPFYKNSIKVKGVILMNLGSPDSTNVKDLRKYLHQFLMDKRVIDKPWLLRFLLVKGLIVPFRASKSAEAYRAIWNDEGSPLIQITKQLKNALQRVVDTPVEIAMRYGNPGTEAGFEALIKTNPQIDEVLVIPLYPHYAMSSYETAVEYAKDIHRKKKYSFRLSFIDPFYDEPKYLQALAHSIKPFLNQPFDQILFSYHGIPERHIHKSDITGNHCLLKENCCDINSEAHKYCYRYQVRTTTKMICNMLQIPEEKYSISFQSRLGKGWLTPFTDIRLNELPGEDIKHLLIVCPAFVSDCLETLEEIEMRGKEIFMEAGGNSFTMIPCLNVNPEWVEALAGYAQ